MKIIIAEGGTAHNVGSMALIENAINVARMKYPESDITVLSHDPKSVIEALKKDELGEKIKVIGDIFIIPNGGMLKKILWLIQCLLWIIYTRFLFLFSKRISGVLLGRRKYVLQEVESAEYIYCIGAERINDIYFKTALLSLYAIGTYIKMGKKLVHMSLTIGPVFYKSTIAVAKRVLNKSHAIFVRDMKSYEILKKWNCKASFQFCSYDIALLQKKDESKTAELLKEFNLKPGFIGVSVIFWSFRKAIGPARQYEYNKAHAEVLDYMVEKYNKDIVFTPTVVDLSNHPVDVEAGDGIIALMKHKERVTAVRRLLSPVEMATLFSQCQFSIVTRMHAAILCSGAGGRPIIAVNYLYKLREYMKNIGFEDYSIDIDYVNVDSLKEFVDTMMENYGSNLAKLHNRQSELRDVLISDLKKI